MNIWNQRFFAAETEGGAGDATAAATTTENPATSSTDEIMNIMKHDPFPGGEAPKEGKAGKGKPGKAAEAKDVTAATETTAATAPAADPEKELLKQSNAHAMELLEAYKGRSTEAKPRGEAAPADSSATGKPPSYGFNIPDQLVTALTSEDPAMFKQGLAGFAQGVAQSVHQQMALHLKAAMSEAIAQALPQMINSHMSEHTSRQAIFNDFYGTYKELNNKRLYPVIAQITGEVQKEMKSTTWSPAMRDTIAKRTKDFLTSLGVKVANGTEPAAKATHPKLGGGNNSRPSVETVDKTERDILETLGFGGFD